MSAKNIPIVINFPKSARPKVLRALQRSRLTETAVNRFGTLLSKLAKRFNTSCETIRKKFKKVQLKDLKRHKCPKYLQNQ